MNHVTEILKLLEKNTAAGAWLSTVFSDWLDLTHATLSMMPRHVQSLTASGQLATDPPEINTIFARCRGRYQHADHWRRFTEAFAMLLDSAEGFWDPNHTSHEAHGWDVLGALYMQTAYKQHSGQFFTPWNVAEAMARMTIMDGAGEVADRLRQAQQTASARDDANAHFLAATVLAGLAVPQEQVPAYFDARILPLVIADYHPITICDPCVGSGVMLLASARQFPAWTVHAGLVQFYGMDIDQTCVQMAQCNAMLYGLNGHALRNALFAPREQIASLPEPFVAAYSLAQEAHAAGDDAQVQEIAAALRTQQMLFNPDDYAVNVRTPTPSSPPLAPSGERWASFARTG